MDRAKTVAFGLTTINGLPAHVLLVHAVATLVPLTTLCSLICLKPQIARRFGVALPILGVGTLLLVFAAMNAGGWLQNHIPNTALMRAHTHIAGQLWPFSTGAALMTIAIWYLNRAGSTTFGESPGAGSLSRATVGSVRVSLIVAVVTVVVALGSLVEVVRIGESGSRAAWTGHFTQSSASMRLRQNPGITRRAVGRSVQSEIAAAGAQTHR